jgi:hypothetical protein
MRKCLTFDEELKDARRRKYDMYKKRRKILEDKMKE